MRPVRPCLLSPFLVASLLLTGTLGTGAACGGACRGVERAHATGHGIPGRRLAIRLREASAALGNRLVGVPVCNPALAVLLRAGGIADAAALCAVDTKSVQAACALAAGHMLSSAGGQHLAAAGAPAAELAACLGLACDAEVAALRDSAQAIGAASAPPALDATDEEG